jgi:hypothetical protein
MIITLIDKIWPVCRPIKVGDRVTDLTRFGTVIDIVGKKYNVVNWDQGNQVVHLTEELQLTRKRKV